MKLENERLCVEIAERGAEVVRIYDKKKEQDILWDGKPEFWKRHSPILFPNVGKTWNNKVLFDGNQYPSSQHGFARDNDFLCVRAEEKAAVWLLRSSEETKEVYPFEFELYIMYKLEKNRLYVKWEVKNHSGESMYFTIGGHPAFWCAKGMESRNDCYLKFPGKDRLEYIGVDLKTGTALPETKRSLELKDGYCKLSDELFELDTMIFDGGQIEEAWICHLDGTPFAGVECKDFPNFGIWSVKDSPFVCLEPWAGRCDNHGFEKDVSEKPGINRVEPGGSFQKEYAIVAG
ncbi:aldose 1-epimerase family protein [Mediterraneibacter sp. ICN-202921]|uniref:aldose 1-epimerase family protein n=1 Tax=Mediterraneibacter sp. ICN-202921 TaxID=3134657 RepID=UPI0030C0BDA2